ncbi:MAG TPA: beta-galactosidase [Candidatus Hydrogenedentes bacterium]|nr:beta-galactosidase [Candidatus Hydrogenedentota bacterium]
MKSIGRRRFLALTAAGLSCAALGNETVSTSPIMADKTGVLDALGLKRIGQVTPRPSKSIEASPLSVGFEVLDRKCFNPVRTYEHLAQLGVKWARCQTGWCRCETERGNYDFKWLDDVVDSLLAIGIQPWFNLGYGNTLYTPSAPDEYAVGWVPVYDDTAMQAWLRFTQALAEHFAARVKHWEIWNEPNISNFWQPNKPNAHDYVNLVAQTAPVIRKAVSGASIIGLACSGIKMEYIEACLEAGLTDHIDIVSYHPYRALPEDNYDREILRLREAISTRRKGIELWQGENGCPSQGGPESVGALSKLNWTETSQAKWLLRRILIDLRLGIALTSYFHTVDLLNYRSKTNFKGLLRGADYTPKPAYYAYQCLCALFDAKTKPTALSPIFLDQDTQLIQQGEFVRDGRALYACWFPANLQQEWKMRTISLRLTFPEDAAITDPVLIDPLDGKAYAPTKTTASKRTLEVHDLPLLDYPLILTDRQLVANTV